MTKPVTGGCMCGAVRYELSADPFFSGNCYCRSCQKAGGGAMASAMGVPKAALKITGKIRYFDVTADSGNTASRGFCPTCGSRVVSKNSGHPEMMALTAGSLDDPGIFKPGADIFVDKAPSWVHMDPDLPKFPGMPEMPNT